VILIEDERNTREGLAALIGNAPGMEIGGKYSSGEDALCRAPHDGADLVLTDLGLPGMSGVEVTRRLREILPKTPILILTVYGADDHIFDALCAGANGYLLKDAPPERLLAAIREAHLGGAPMSPEIARRVVLMFRKLAPRKAEHQLSAREIEVLQLLADGHSYKSCATRLSISVDTIRFHVRHIYDALHVHSKSEAVIKALKSGWVR
jgi:DNA-binding NarL/FixJ family response regulator